MVGISMVLTIAICIFGAAGLFAWLSRPFSDLIPISAPAAEAPVNQPTTTAPPPTPVPTTASQPTVSAVTGNAPASAATTQAFNPTIRFAPTSQSILAWAVNRRRDHYCVVTCHPASIFGRRGTDDQSQRWRSLDEISR